MFSVKRLANAVFIAVALTSLCVQAGWQQSLTNAELQALEQSVNGNRTQSRAANRLSTGSGSGTLGLEVLLIELQEKKSVSENSSRMAEVFVFDYATATSRVMLLQVDTQEIISSLPINNIHLPLNEREVAEALRLLLLDEALMAALQLEYEAQQGKSLESLDQVDMKVSIWNPGAGRAASHECNESRCALVSLFTKNHYNFSVEPVVNLASGNISLDMVQ